MRVELGDAAEEHARRAGGVQRRERVARGAERVREVHERRVHRGVREARARGRRRGLGRRRGARGALEERGVGVGGVAEGEGRRGARGERRERGGAVLALDGRGRGRGGGGGGAAVGAAAGGEPARVGAVVERADDGLELGDARAEVRGLVAAGRSAGQGRAGAGGLPRGGVVELVHAEAGLCGGERAGRGARGDSRGRA